MRYWLARLSFSCFIVGAAMLWDVYEASKTGLRSYWSARSTLELVGVVLLLGLGMAGTRFRHAEVYRDREEGEENGER
jgi:hypothetical protein